MINNICNVSNLSLHVILFFLSCEMIRELGAMGEESRGKGFCSHSKAKEKSNLISNQQISLQGIAFRLTQQYSRRFGCTVEFRQIPSDGSGIFFIHHT